jgi:hypothetical protein
MKAIKLTIQIGLLVLLLSAACAANSLDDFASALLTSGILLGAVGPSLEVISCSRTAPGATIGAAAAFAGDSLRVKNYIAPARAYLIGAWNDHQAAGTNQIRSSAMHDNQRNIRLDAIISDVQPLLPNTFRQPLRTNDDLIVELSGSAVAGDVEQVSLLLYYEGLEGSQGRFIDNDMLLKRMVNLLTVENTITATAGPAYTGAEALNAEADLLISNTDYAILGFLVDVECLSVCWRGPDTGNVRVAGPGCETGREFTRDWFQNLSHRQHMPLIPVINSNNDGATFVEVAQDENAAAVTVITILAQLA